MTPSEQIAMVREMYGALGAQNFEVFASCIHADFAVVEAPSLPFAGTFAGMEGFSELVGKVFSMFSTFDPQITAISAGDDKVMVWVEMTLTAANTGKTTQMPMIEVFTFKEDKVVEIRPFYYDTDAIKAILAE
jgi:ketosteroid isomerase-like protein